MCQTEYNQNNNFYKTTTMKTYSNFNELTEASEVGVSIDNMSVWNMGMVKDFKGERGARKGLKLIVGADDHGNPHVEARADGRYLAKIFIETPTIQDEKAVAYDPAKKSDLSPQEETMIFDYLSKTSNLNKCKEEWNRCHGNNPAAQKATIITENKNVKTK